MDRPAFPAVPAAPASGLAGAGADRRSTPRRRLRDRIASLDRTSNPTLRRQPDAANMVMLVEDDLREAALALGRVERWLGEAMNVLEDEGVTAAALVAASSDDAQTHVESLADSMANLSTHLRRLAAVIK